MSISNALHNFRDELIKIEESEKENTSVMVRLRKLNLSFLPTLSWKLLFPLELLTFLSLTIYCWAEVHFWKRNSSYFMEFWLMHLFIFFGVFIILRGSSSSPSLRSLLKEFWPLLLCHVVLTIDYCLDFDTFTKKSAGTEYYQFTQVLLVPVLFIILNEICGSKLPSKVIYLSLAILIWQMSILFSDMEFHLSFNTSLFSLVIASVYGFYLVLLRDKLSVYSVLEVIFVLSLSIVLVLPVFILFYHSSTQNKPNDGFTIYKIMNIILMAILKVLSWGLSLVTLKRIHPLLALLTFRLVSIPDHFIQALVYKLDCVLSGSKVCIIAAIQFIVVHVIYLFSSEDTK